MRSGCRHSGGEPCTCAMGSIYRFVEPVLLYLLHQGRASYGYELHQVISEHALTSSPIDPAAVYRTLRALEENGNVVSEWDTACRGPARRKYSLTPAGEKHLREWADTLSQLSTSLTHFVGSVHAAMGQGGTPGGGVPDGGKRVSRLEGGYEER